jgi:hypothetical protein
MNVSTDPTVLITHIRHLRFMLESGMEQVVEQFVRRQVRVQASQAAMPASRLLGAVELRRGIQPGRSVRSAPSAGPGRLEVLVLPRLVLEDRRSRAGHAGVP